MVSRSKYRANIKTYKTCLAASIIAPFLITAQNALAQTETATPNPNPAVEETIVFGRGAQQIGEAGTASEGTVSGADLAIRPLLQVAELLEVVPGMVAVQHSGSGKANQYFLRGFNLDHGTDFTILLILFRSISALMGTVRVIWM